MGRHFGDLAVIRGIIYYKLSPHELKPFATAFAHGIPNLVPRTLGTMYTWFPIFLAGYITYVSVEAAYRKGKKKNVKDFAHEDSTRPPKCRPK